MTRASVSRTASASFRRTRGAADVGLVVALTICGWCVSQWRAYEEERRALETLNSALLQKSVDEHSRERAYADTLSDDGSLDRSSFRALSHLRKIRTLQIVRTDIDRGLGPSLEKLQQLHALVLSDVDVSDEDMKYVAQLRKLDVLYVDSSTLTDAGVAHLANSRIFRLSLGGCTKVTDRSVRQLGKLTTLGLLDLRHTRVTNACLPALARLPKLHSVLVDGTEINKSRPGFVGVLNGDGDVWYPSEARRNEVAGE